MGKMPMTPGCGQDARAPRDETPALPGPRSRENAAYQVLRIHSRSLLYSMWANRALAMASPSSMAPR
jgi:hypothetical protein